MSVYQMVKKMASGDVVKNKVTILEGWDKQDIAKYLEEKSKGRASLAIKQLLSLSVKKAVVLINGQEIKKDIENILETE